MSDFSKRRSKLNVILISDDEDEPAAKRTTKVLPPQGIVELQAKVIKLEKDFEGSCRYARRFELQLEESQKRVAFLESLLDKKPAVADDTTNNKVVEELQKKLSETSNQLEDANNSVRIREEKIDSLTKFLETMRADADADRNRDRARIAELSMHLEEATRKEKNAAMKELDTAQEMNGLKMEIIGLRTTICSIHDDSCALQERVSSLTSQLETEQQLGRDEHSIDRAKIDELPKKVAQYEGGLQQLQQAVQKHQPRRHNDATVTVQEQPPSAVSSDTMQQWLKQTQPTSTAAAAATATPTTLGVKLAPVEKAPPTPGMTLSEVRKELKSRGLKFY